MGAEGGKEKGGGEKEDSDGMEKESKTAWFPVLYTEFLFLLMACVSVYTGKSSLEPLQTAAGR